ncbi:MAG: hypothetical protein HWN81_06380 [Candidatus Lokiarchaeota archaeon]|nr:hypothetical protein [Candidatus Lokiarchaeota archaeon]
MVNRTLDYGFNWTIYQQDNIEIENHNDSIIFQQLKYFNEKDQNKKGYVKALYLHHLLDFFKETYVNIYDMDLVFEKFLQDKIVVEIMDSDGNNTNFQEEIQDIFQLLRDNKEELYVDLKGVHSSEFEK